MSEDDNNSEAGCLAIRKKRKYVRRSVHQTDGVLDSTFSKSKTKTTSMVDINTDNDSENLDVESDQTNMDDIPKQVKSTKNDFQSLLEKYDRKQLTSEQFENLVSLKAEKTITEGNNMCTGCANKIMDIEKEQYWQRQYETSIKTLKQIMAIAKSQISNNESLINKKTSGTQTLFSRKEETIIPHSNDIMGNITYIVNNDDVDEDKKPIVMFDDDEMAFGLLDAVDNVITSTSQTEDCITPMEEESSSTHDQILPPVPPAIPINDSIQLSNGDEPKVHGRYNNCTTSTQVDEPQIKISNVFTLSNHIVEHPESSIKEQHPAPLPETTYPKSVLSCGSLLPPAPYLNIIITTQGSPGVVLSWQLPSTKPCFNNLMGYQIYAYREVHTDLPKTVMWKNIGTVKALDAPMKCTLYHFKSGDKYHFAVRAIDNDLRVGPFSRILSHTAKT